MNMNDDTDVERDEERVQHDELIRVYLLARAVEGAQCDSRSGWVRDLIRAHGSKASQR